MMAPSVRNSVARKTDNSTSHFLNDGGPIDTIDDDKSQKSKSQNARFYYKLFSLGGILFFLLIFYAGRFQVNHSGGITAGKNNVAKVLPAVGVEKLSNNVSSKSGGRDVVVLTHGYELFPFLVDPSAVASGETNALSKPTLPPFPMIPRLEDCSLAWRQPKPPRKEPDWRSMFWLPSFPGSGGANPAKDGDLIRELVEGLFLGDIEDRQAYHKPVKNFHMSIKKRLKRCVGLSETIGCSCGHPLVSTSPEAQTDKFRSEVVMAIRNPATSIPESFTIKHIAYHSGTKQASVDNWRIMRDEHFEKAFQSWMDMIRYWRGTSTSYYRTELYVPFEDLVTSDAEKGKTIVQKLSNVLSGNGARIAKSGETAASPGFFETTTSEKDSECLWYRIAKAEWNREQQIIGDYIPPFTKNLQTMMVQNLTAYAIEVENELGNEGKKDNDSADSVLATILRRYAYQIQHYLVVED